MPTCVKHSDTRCYSGGFEVQLGNAILNIEPTSSTDMNVTYDSQKYGDSAQELLLGFDADGVSLARSTGVNRMVGSGDFVPLTRDGRR